MTTAIPRRRRWVAVLLSLLLGPFMAMLYVNRGRLALLYFAVGLVVSVTAAAFLPIGSHTSGWIWLAQLPINLVGAVHSARIAGNWQDGFLRWYAHWYSLVGIYLLFPAAALLIRTFLYQPFSIPTTSMSPTLNSGDYIFAEKFAYKSSAPRRGDVIIFRVPSMGNDEYVKRIVGLPGDRIQMKNGILYVNGNAAPQRPVGRFRLECGVTGPCLTPQLEETLPGGSRHLVLDLLPNGALDNTPEFRVGTNTYFVMGDNRDNSNDSRADVGPVPRDLIVGRVRWKFVEHGHWTWQPIQ